MVGTVDDGDFDVDQVVAGENACRQAFFDPFDGRRDVFFGNDAADDLADDFVAFAFFVRLDLELDVSVLTAAAGLLDELGLALARDGDRLFVGDLGFTDIGFDAEFALHPVVEDLEVQLAHTGDDRLAGFFVRGDAERGIFFRKSAEGHGKLFAVGFGFWLDSHRDHRLWELHLLKKKRVVFGAERIACAGVF